VNETLPILLAVYRRQERLPALMDQLQAQTDQKFVLVSTVNGARKNEGGFGRYVDFARLGIVSQFAILLDDDVDVRPDFVAWCRASAEPRTVKGRHGRRFGASYWDQTFAAPGEECACVSSQGTVLDADLLRDKLLTGAHPDTMIGMEDVWLCYRASEIGFRVIAADPPVEVIEDGKDSFRALRTQKEHLLALLRARGWRQ